MFHILFEANEVVLVFLFLKGSCPRSGCMIIHLKTSIEIFTGLCHLPCPCEAWWKEEASSQGYRVWEANQPGCHPTQIPT